MSFIVASMNCMSMTSEINTKNFQLMMMSTEYQRAEEDLSNYEIKASSDDKTTAKEKAITENLQSIVNYYDMQKEQLQNDLALLKADLDSTQKLVDDGIKSDKFSLSV